MSSLSSHRCLVVAKATVLLVALATTAAFGAARMSAKPTPKGAFDPAGFKTTGKLALPLRPGTSQALDLRLTNPHKWDLRVVRLSIAISVDRAHEAAGCRRGTQFRQVRIPPRFYPLRLRARSTRTLRQLGVKYPPRIVMRDLPRNQDACKGAKLTLRFARRSARWSGSKAR